MSTTISPFIPWKPILAVSLFLVVLTFWFVRWVGPVPVSDPSLFFAEDLVWRTSPPAEVAIELSESELAEIGEAYESGFDHPDLEGGDPCRRLQLLPHKKLSAWRRQFRKRGFTMKKVKDMLKNGRRETHIHPQKGTAYTRIYDSKGNWIIVDFVDCLIWQVAPYNFK